MHQSGDIGGAPTEATAAPDSGAAETRSQPNKPSSAKPSDQPGPGAGASSDDRPAPAKRKRRRRHRSRRGRGRKPNSDKIYGALDLGTNNCRLLVARRARGGFQVVDSFSRIVRLGEGVSATGVLSDAAMNRALAALKICSEKMARRGVTRARTIATEACRAAGNGAEFLARVKAETGLELDIVTTEDEARLAVAGCAPLVDRTCGSALVFDIGGGSTELMWVGIEGTKRPSIRDWTSLSCGVVTLAEHYGGADVSDALFDDMVADVSGQLASFAERCDAAEALSNGGFHLLGTSGTVTTVAGVHLGLERYDRSQVDGTWVTPDEVRRVTDTLLGMGYDGRAAHPCIGRERADLVLAGCAILEAIHRAWPADRLRVADRGLREGILMSLIGADEARRRRRRRQRKRSRVHAPPAPATAD